jgi:hypothetical protein
MVLRNHGRMYSMTQLQAADRSRILRGQAERTRVARRLRGRRTAR